MGTKQAYLFFGDEFAAGEAARERLDQLLPEADRALGLEIVEAHSENAAEAFTALNRVFDALQTVGFLGGRKVTWMRDANFLSENKVGRVKDVKTRLGELAALIKGNLAPGQVLLVTAPGADKRYAFYKACKETGEVREFALPKKDWESAKFALAITRDTMQKAGLQAGEAVVHLFADKVGADTREIVNEVEKLAVALGDRKRVEPSDVETLTCSSREIPAWDLADAVGSRRPGQAIRVLRRLLFQRRTPISLVIGLEQRARDLLLFREALDRGWLAATNDGRSRRWQWRDLPADAARAFETRLAVDPRSLHWYRVGILAQQAANYSGKELLAGARAAATAHEEMVSSKVPSNIILELLVLRMTA